MKNKQILFTLLMIFANCGFAQSQGITTDSLKALLAPVKLELQTLKAENNKLKNELKLLTINLNDAKNTIYSLQLQTQTNSRAINETATQLGLQISTAENVTNQKIQKVDQSLSNKSLVGIIVVLFVILFSGIVYWFFNKTQKKDKKELIEQLSKTRLSIEESLVKELSKQTELMNTQLKLIEQQKTTIQSLPNIEPDHSLALKVASEINLIERNVNLMDAGTKGLKQLVRSIGKLKDNLAANGYEMPELLGKPYNRGMILIVVSTLPEENLKKDEEIITKVLIPQVNYIDKMIQTAQVEVSIGV